MKKVQEVTEYKYREIEPGELLINNSMVINIDDAIQYLVDFKETLRIPDCDCECDDTGDACCGYGECTGYDMAPSTKAMIDAYTDKYPNSHYGPGHIVLSDYNVEDCYIKRCLGLTKAALHKDARYMLEPDEERMNTLDWYSNMSKEDLERDIAFLEKLLAIPEELR